MGSVNHGTQTITYQYYLEATGANFGKRFIDILPCGIYSGGYLTRVSDSEVTLSTLVAEIRDSGNQISASTASAVTLNSTTLDSGTISSGTPYLVLRWAYAASAVNYVEIHAIASVAAALDNDIIIGKCSFSGSVLTGFDYTDRTFLMVQNLFLKVETSSGLYVQLRNGRIHTPTGYVTVPETKVGPFSVPTASNSRIDLVYIATDGTPTILAGTQAVSPTAPAYAGKMVVAEVTVVNGDSSIPADQIVDVRISQAPAIRSNHYLSTFGSTVQQIANGVFTKADLGDTKNISGITVSSNQITLAANRKYALSYSVQFAPTSLSDAGDPTCKAKFVVMSGDTSWDLEVISYKSSECEGGANNVVTNMSKTCWFIPSSETVIELQIFTENTTEKAQVGDLSVNIMSVD